MAPHPTGTPPDSTSAYTPPDTPPSFFRPLAPGIYAPTCCFFFDGSEDLDTAAIGAHAVRLASAGLAGITTMGSNGESVHLSRSERSQVTATTRQALDAAGFHRMPLVVGCGASSTRETVELCRDAFDAGGDAALVLSPSYFSCSRQDLLEHFRAVARASPIPVLIYNYPGAAAGIDLDSDFLVELSKFPGIVGTKLTCGNVGKLNRVATATATISKSKAMRGAVAATGLEATGGVLPGSASAPPAFLALAGSGDILVSSLIAGGSGAIAGLANVAPKACVECFAAFERGNLERACQIQAVLARADWALQKSGVPGVKAALQSYFGYGGSPRSPLRDLSSDKKLELHDDLAEVMALEKAL